MLLGMAARSHSPLPSDVELLRIEMDLLWPSKGPELVMAAARDGLHARVGGGLPARVARKLIAEVESTQVSGDMSAPPAALERWCTELEDALGSRIALAPGSGPSYLVHDGVSFPSGATLIRSDAADLSELREANPGNWGSGEWHDLLDGRLGAWVMARHGAQVISICHTPAANTRAAEAGTWTHPDFRGHGYASATTAEWAAVMRRTRRVLFYSTSYTNHSSQAVAARLGLRNIGWLWQLTRQ
jgi:Acetyltransferase (GNAT) domain